MHHITYIDYSGREATVKLKASQIGTVMFFTQLLRDSGIPFEHTFWD